MGKRRRKKRPVGPPPEIHQGHFKLLEAYGKHPLPKTVGKREQQKVWQMLCHHAGVANVDRERVVDAWKTFVGGQSQYSSIAINGDIDPSYTTLGVTYLGKITAAHTTKTTALLRRVMKIFAKRFTNRTDFLNAAERLCGGVANAIFGEEK